MRVLGGRFATALVVMISTAVLLFSVGGWSVYSYADRNVRRIGLDLGGGGQAAKHDAANYLLVGTDNREGLDGLRSDTTMLIHVAEDRTTTVVSFPRDTLVVIPEYTDADGEVHKEHRAKFNSAIAKGGPPLLVDMVQSLTGMTIDHYVSVDLEGFKTITDAIGGVDVCVLPSDVRKTFTYDGIERVSTNTYDSMSGWSGGPGTVHVNGDQALAFVRQRYGFDNGDIARIDRQQHFLGAVFRKATSGDVLTNPIKSSALLRAATAAITVDDNTSLDELMDLGLSMKGMATGAMQVATLPTRAPGSDDGGNPDNGEMPGYGAVQLYDPIDLAKIVVPLGGHVDGVSLDGSGTAGPGQTPGPVTVPPARVSVSVQNGAGISGLATKATTALVDEGFRATTDRDVPDERYETSEVLYGPGLQDAAWTVQAAIPGSTAREDADITGISLVVGADYDGVVTPAMAAATPAAAPPPAPAPPAAPPGPPPPPCVL